MMHFGLELEESKTRLIEFGRFAESNRKERGTGKPETFTFLGFTHYCSHGRTGKFGVKRKTSKKKLYERGVQGTDEAVPTYTSTNSCQYIWIVVDGLALQGAGCGKTARPVLRGVSPVRDLSDYQSALNFPIILS